MEGRDRGAEERRGAAASGLEQEKEESRAAEEDA